MRNAMIKKLLLNQGKYETVEGIPPLTLEKSLGKDLRDYKLYGNSFQDGTPTPDTPIEVESVGEKTINLYEQKKEKIVGSYCGLPMLDWEKGYYTLQIKLREGKSVPTGAYFGFIYDNTKANWLIQDGVLQTSSYTGNTYAINADTLNVQGVCCYPTSKSEEVWEAFDILLVKGNYNYKNTPSYEPFGYKVPIVAQGKNLFNPTPTSIQWQVTTTILDYNEIQQTGKSTTNPNGYSQFMIHLKPGKYSVSVKLKTNGTGTSVPSLNVWGTANAGSTVKVFNLNNNSTTSSSLTITEEKDYYIALYGRCYENETAFFQVQIEYGNTTTDFEPYLDETYTTNIYLTEPLRKAGTVADYVDFANGKVVRNIKEKSFNGTEDWYLWKTQSDGSISYALLDVIPVGNAGNRTVISNMFTYSRNSYTKNTIDAFGFAEQRGWVAATVEGEFLPTLDDYKDFLSTQNSVGLPLKVYYEERIEQLIDLPQLPTLKGTTVYTIDTTIQPSNMAATYKRR